MSISIGRRLENRENACQLTSSKRSSYVILSFVSVNNGELIYNVKLLLLFYIDVIGNKVSSLRVHL